MLYEWWIEDLNGEFYDYDFKIPSLLKIYFSTLDMRVWAAFKLGFI